MKLSLFSGTANPALAQAVAEKLGQPLGRAILHRFPDGEFHAEVEESVRGRDVYLVQPTGPPVAEHLLELLLLADACRRAGAARLTGIIPCFGYARQDRRASGREPGAAPQVAVVVSHALLVGPAAQHLKGLPIGKFVVTDSVPAPADFPVPMQVVSLAPLLAEAIQKLNQEGSLGDLIVHA